MRPAVSARRRRASSSVRPVAATPTRFPRTKRRLTRTFASATFWWISELAKRVKAASSALTSTSASVAPAISAWWRTISAIASRSAGVPPVRISMALTS